MKITKELAERLFKVGYPKPQSLKGPGWTGTAHLNWPTHDLAQLAGIEAAIKMLEDRK